MHEITFDEKTLLRLKEIKQRLLTDDPRFTANPIWQVREEKRVYGIAEGYGEDGWEWHDTRNSEPVSDIMAWLEHHECDMDAFNNADDPEDYLFEKGIIKVFYKNMQSVSQTCFTEQGAKDYIAANKNNLTNPFIYVDSLWRNAEMIFLREFLSNFPIPEII